MKAAIEIWLTEALGKIVPHGTRIDRDQPVFTLGVDSVRLAVLTADLAEAFEVELDATLFYEAPTIAEAADRVAAICIGTNDPPPARVSGEAAQPALAIVGLSCRMPGAPGRAAFWRLLLNGRCAIAAKNPRRVWMEAAAAGPDRLPAAAGYLDAVDQFDAAFFRIAPAEAMEMDPQQRLLLQIAWEALDDAGLPPLTLKGENVGVFVGVSHSEYGAHHFSAPERVSGLSGTGNALSITANRISYALDLRGPSLAVDTACSSSLTALHIACMHLRDRQCDAALVGGANLIVGTTLTTALHRAGMLSPNGTCRPFEARANGYVRGEGCGVVVLKRLEDAIRDEDRIYAVVKGTAVNQDGRSASLTAPNPRAQEALLRAASRQAGIDPAALDYVEAHGTGTPLGDPVEATVLGRIFGEGRAAANALPIGLVKANIGHLEAASGIAGLIKMCLALHHGVLPAQPGFQQPNPRIDFGALGLQVADTARPWPRDGKQVCGVSSFGFGGANAHAILQGPPPWPLDPPDDRPVMVALHAPSDTALRRQATRWARWLATEGEEHAEDSLASIGDTSVFRRARMAFSRSFVATSKADLERQLTAFAAEPPAPASARPRPRVAFDFPAFTLSPADWKLAETDPDPLFRSAAESVRDHRDAICRSCPAGWSPEAWEQLAIL